MNETVLCFAPGDGLGHLNRAVALCLALRAIGVGSRIVTNSLYAQGVASLARLPVTVISSHNWKAGAPIFLASHGARVVVVDTFPFGIRGEWCGRFAGGVATLLLARRLCMDRYRTAVPAADVRYTSILAVEPLDHAEWLAGFGPITWLGGVIRLPEGTIATPVPPATERILDSGRATLVVHSGPREELDQLTALAAEPRVVIAVSAIDYYPAVNLMSRAARIVTGGGYNCMADALPWRERHVPTAFPRDYDNQAARIATWNRVVDRTAAAAQHIAHLMTA